MLPYTPLHYLIIKESGLPLVMTSGNVSDEPIAYKDNEALKDSKVLQTIFSYMTGISLCGAMTRS